MWAHIGTSFAKFERSNWHFPKKRRDSAGRQFEDNIMRTSTSYSLSQKSWDLQNSRKDVFFKDFFQTILSSVYQKKNVFAMLKKYFFITRVNFELWFALKNLS